MVMKTINYIRNCPKCNDIIGYKNKKQFLKSSKNNTLCISWSLNLKFNNKNYSFLDGYQEDILVGSLLGDGHLNKRKYSKNAQFRILRSENDIDYLKYEFSYFNDFCSTGIKTQDYFDKRTKKIYSSCYFCTTAHSILFNSK